MSQVSKKKFWEALKKEPDKDHHRQDPYFHQSRRKNGLKVTSNGKNNNKMLTIKELTVKNFMSVGNQAQAINFANKSLVLVIGENMDLGGDDAGARNGTGKTTIINALSYVFFGEALTNIRRDNLVNKTNEKGMLVLSL